MKKINYIIIAIALVVIGKEGFTNKTGAPSGRTGSLGDAGVTCASPYCHSGPTPTNEMIFITSNIPMSGYVPSETYMITVNMEMPGISRFGFEATVEDNSGMKVGTLSADNINTKMSGSAHITHHLSSVDASNEKSWTFNWQAPSTSVGVVSVYVAGNFANANNMSSGDVIATAFREFLPNNVGVNELQVSDIEIYPNPVCDIVNISNNNEKLVASVYDMQGKLVKLYRDITTSIDVQSLDNGYYTLILEKKGGMVRKNLVIQK